MSEVYLKQILSAESIISNREFPSEPTYKNIVPSPKRKRITERQQKGRFKLDDPSDETEINNSIKNDDKTSYNPSWEKVKQNYDETRSQNIVSTIADKQFQCQKCDKSFSCQPNLNKHTNSTHEGVKYPGTDCNYKATQKVHL